MKLLLTFVVGALIGYYVGVEIMKSFFNERLAVLHYEVQKVFRDAGCADVRPYDPDRDL